MFFIEDKDEDTLVTHYLLQQEALVVGVPQMLHRSGQIKRAMTLVMHKYVQITSRQISCTPLCIFVGGTY
jgi:hypothetical protein